MCSLTLTAKKQQVRLIAVKKSFTYAASSAALQHVSSSLFHVIRKVRTV